MEVALYESCSAWKLQCMGVRCVGELRCGGVAVWGSFCVGEVAVWELLYGGVVVLRSFV